MINKYKAVISDMDGLLLDTERIALNTFIDTCRGFHFEPNIEVYLRCIGTNSEKTREILTEGYGQDFPFKKFNLVWSEKYKTAITDHPIPMKSGVIDLLDYLQQSHMKMAVATSTKYETAVEKLQSTGLYHFFEIIVGGDQVERGKPDPDIYLKVSSLLIEEPRKCLVLEDSDNGVISAFRAGMNVVQIPDLKEPSKEVKNLGHPILSSLGEVESFFKLVVL